MADCDLLCVYGSFVRLHNNLHHHFRDDTGSQWARNVVSDIQSEVWKILTCFCSVQKLIDWLKMIFSFSYHASNSPPYDGNSVYGYFLNQIVLYLGTHGYAVIFIAIVAFFVGTCFYLEAFCDDHASTLNECDEMILKQQISKIRIVQNIRFYVKIVE